MTGERVRYRIAGGGKVRWADRLYAARQTITL